MSTFFVGEGNIGSAPEFQEFNSPPDEPRRLLRLNVYFDNPVPRDGGYEDRGGYWAWGFSAWPGPISLALDSSAATGGATPWLARNSARATCSRALRSPSFSLS